MAKMRIAVVFESTFGNTEKVAVAVAGRLREQHFVELVPVDHADEATLDGIDLLVAGGPTHAHGLSRPSTRRAPIEDAARKGETVTSVTDPDEGLRDWAKMLGRVDGLPAAVFDTRFDKPVALVGSAAQVLARKLRHHGFRIVGEPKSFFVTNTEGPLAADELEHARRWADEVLEALPARTG